MSRKKKVRVERQKKRVLFSYTLVNLDCDNYIDFHAKALKYILLEKDWDSLAPNTKYDSDPRVARYQKSFNEFTRNHMYRDTELNRQLKSFVGFDTISKKSFKLRQRKSRVSRLWKESTKILKKKCVGVNKPDQGLTIFTISTKRHYLV